MKRFGDLERKYVLEALDNEFNTSLNNVFNARLEKLFAEFFGVKYAIGFVNGTATLHTALAACGVERGDEVVVPPLTMSSPAISVLQNGSVPVFADVDKETFNILPQSIEKVTTSRTKAIMPVALYGLSPDYDAIRKVTKKLPIIEDNAECFLGTYKGKLVGTFGEFASFSFQASKHLTTGEGGMLVTDNEELADKARKFSCLGYASVSSKKGKISREDIQDPKYSRHVSVGFNYRMSEVNAAVALGQLERAKELVQIRLDVAKMFDQAVKGFSSVIPQKVPAGYVNSYWTYVVFLNTDKPEEDWYSFRKLFLKNGGDPYYAAWKLSYTEPLFQDTIQKMEGVWQRYEKGLCPNAEYLQPRLIQLKTNYWELDDAKRQAEILNKTLKEWES
ncbi:MAG: DegT/DnrJ/EryC1/StrS family aminotransferase [Fibrobacter sp.]|nr:DegT/DnrJ/EryC1/StrS family aminotransferase [Fibrobacter sp.]